MTYDELEPHLSTPRIVRYFNIYNDKGRAKALYEANVRLCRSFHPVLGTLEVALRNNVYKAIENHLGDPDWIVNEKSGFMSSKTVAGTGYYLRRCVQKTEQKFARRQIPIISSKVIAEQYLSFWTELFEPHYFGLLAASPIAAFPHLPNTFARQDVARRLKIVRKWRNRINHNEPLIIDTRTHALDLKYPAQVHAISHSLLKWIEPKLSTWIAPLDSVRVVLKHCSGI